MDIVLVVLRLLHILAAVAWVGAGIMQVLVIEPAIRSAGEGGLRFAKAMGNVPAARMIFPIGGGLTVICGILLYLVGNASSHFTQTGNIVLGIGAVAGLAAAVHGGAILSRGNRELGELINRYVTDTGVAADGMAAIRAKVMDLSMHSRISLALMIIALVCMGSARYL